MRRTAQTDLTGLTLGRYRILEQLGGGGMGEVYRAEDLRLHRHVAIKVLPPRLASRPEALERFEREAAAVGALNHPNIVTIHSIEEVEGRRLITMELVEGKTLHQLVPEEGYSAQKCVEIAVPLTTAVAAAHQRGVTHRDIKPANIMVSHDGLVKVVDFGLAKLRQTVDDEDLAMAPEPTLTREGQVLGTVPYMAPEQFQGLPADHRSDVFALGVVIYEMMTGRHPFPGDTQPLVISSILRDPPQPIDNVRRDLPPALRTVVARCLEKAPDQRYQDAVELNHDLVALKHKMDSDAILRGAGRRPSDLWRVAVVALALMAATIGGYWLLGRSSSSQPGPATAPAADGSGPSAGATLSMPAVAVLHFLNTSRSDELDWLRGGLADMFITDLSQSRALRVVAADQMYKVLSQLEWLESTPRPTAELTRKIAELTGATAVVTGGFARLGDTIRIDVQIRDASTGEVRESVSEEAVGEASVFGLVDRLSQVVRLGLEVGTTHVEPATDRDIETVTTASVQAYRLYLEGANLHRQVKMDEAISLYERAVELDPGFAMAYARLVAAHVLRANFKAAKRYAALAFEHAERLPDRERGFIEGAYYSSQRTTYPRAIAALEETVHRFPDHFPARRSLGHLYGYIERLEDALAQYQPMFEQDAPIPGIANAIAHMEGMLDRFDAGYEALQVELARHPSEWVHYMTMAVHMTGWNRLDEAMVFLEQAENLRPDEPMIDYSRWRTFVLRGEYEEAAASAGKLIGSSLSTWRHRGHIQRAFVALYRGDNAAAMESFETAEASSETDLLLRAVGLCRQAETLILLGQPEQALSLAKQAQHEAADDWPGWEGIVLEATTRQALGDAAGADAARDRFAAKVPESTELSIVERRFLHRLDGELALARGDTSTAVDHLDKALALLPPRGIHWDWVRYADHAAVWESAARAAEAFGDSESALVFYQRIADSGIDRHEDPVRYVRSLYHAGRLLAGRAEGARARRYLARFLSLWEQGTFDRDLVAAARRLMADS